MTRKGNRLAWNACSHATLGPRRCNLEVVLVGCKGPDEAHAGGERTGQKQLRVNGTGMGIMMTWLHERPGKSGMTGSPCWLNHTREIDLLHVRMGRNLSCHPCPRKDRRLVDRVQYFRPGQVRCLSVRHLLHRSAHVYARFRFCSFASPMDG